MCYGYLYAIALRSKVKMGHFCIYGKRNTCTKSAKKPKDAIIRPVFISFLSDLTELIYMPSSSLSKFLGRHEALRNVSQDWLRK